MTRDSLPGCLTWAALAAVAWLAVSALSGCGGASAETRSAYAIEQAHCLANERAIVDRPPTTLEADREAIEVERARCDAALRSIAP